jgi:Cdc6-like AAA superfamily ATPase
LCFGSGLGTIDISREQNWPNASTLNLDDSQYGAFVTAMKSKLALIQGPPGTGKTVVGLKNEVFVKQTSDPKVNSFRVTQLTLLYCATLKLILQVTPFWMIHNTVDLLLQ